MLKRYYDTKRYYTNSYNIFDLNFYFLGCLKMGVDGKKFFFYLGGVNKWKWVVIFVKFWS